MHFTCVWTLGGKESAQEPVITFHVTFCMRLFVVCPMENITDGSISLTCAFPFCSKPSALRPARMKEPAQLQIHAVVLVGGLDGHVKKVWTALSSFHTWPALLVLLEYFASYCVCGRILVREGKSTGVAVHILAICHCLRINQSISEESMDECLSLIPFCLQPSAPKPARMVELVQLQIPATVLLVGLEALVVKVCEMHTSVVTVQNV